MVKAVTCTTRKPGMSMETFQEHVLIPLAA
jgi:hypothetical protein